MPPCSIRTARASAWPPPRPPGARGSSSARRCGASRSAAGTRRVRRPAARSAPTRVVVATGMPTPLFKSLARHFWFRSAYLALTEPRAGEDPPAAWAAATWSSATRRRRRTSSAGSTTSACSSAGADGDVAAASVCASKVVVQRTGQLMYELSTLYPDISGILPAYGWDAPYARTADGLPYIGPHRNFPASPVRVRRLEPQRDRRVPRQPDSAAPLPRRGSSRPTRPFGFTAAMSVDLLVFGPHPDDLEIGLGGTSRGTRRSGCSVGLCDLDRGEMGSNGTVEERLAGGGGGARGARRGVAREPALARSPHRQGSRASRAGGRVHPAASAARRSRAVLVRSPSRSRRGQRACSPRRRSTRACAAIPAEGEPWKPDWICYYFINDSARRRRSSSTCRTTTSASARRSTATPASSSAAPNAVGTRLNTPLFRQLIESRDAQFGALAGVRWAEGIVVREPLLRPTLLKTRLS